MLATQPTCTPDGFSSLSRSLSQVTAPIPIDVSNALDYRHFDPFFTSMPVNLEL